MNFDFSSAARNSRRDFLKHCGAAAVGLAASHYAVPAWLNARQADVAKQLVTLSEDPHNAEPRLDALVSNWLTPYEHFYVRSHGNTPRIDASQFRLRIEGLVRKPLELSLAELQQRFTKHEVTATLTCAGNRRNEFEKKVPGVQWGPGAVGNALWGGARLADVLEAAEVQAGARHVWFEGLDEVQDKNETIPFGGSVPLEKALANDTPEAGSLLAWEMNGAPLAADHGFPLRSLVPGYIGARSVKWLGKVVVSERPSPNHFLAEAYKLITEDTPAAVEAAPPLYEYLLNSAMVPVKAPRRGDRVVGVRGYALPPGQPNVTIERVEISRDGGKSWQAAQLEDPSRAFCWRLWQAEVPLEANTEVLLARAVDSRGGVQPATVPWNAKGYMNNPYYRLPIGG